LADILPEAFAVVKETARRLAQNKQLKVTAQDFDKDLASEFDFVTVDGDQAIWSNEMAGIGSGANMEHGTLRCAADWWFGITRWESCRNANR